MSVHRLAVVALALLVAACTSADPAIEEVSQPSVSEAGPVELGLRQIPQSVYDDASEGVTIEIADLVAVSELGGIERPAPGADDDEVHNYLSEMLGLIRAEDSRVGVVWLEPDLPNAGPGAVKDEIGLDIGAIETFASLWAPPLSFAVYNGDLALKPSLEVLGEGVLTLGSGEDFSSDFEDVSPLRRIGQPLRLAERDRAIVLSTATPPVRQWATGDFTSLADDDGLVAVARALDEAGVVTAIFVEADFSVREVFDRVPEDERRELLGSIGQDLVSEPFDVVAIGGAMIDGQASAVTSYLFRDEVAAAASIEAVELLWRSSQSAFAARPISELIAFDSIAQDGPVVTVIARPLEGHAPALAYQMLLRQEGLFVHE